MGGGTPWGSSFVDTQIGWEASYGKTADLHHRLYTINTEKCPQDLTDRNIFNGIAVKKPNYNRFKE